MSTAPLEFWTLAEPRTIIQLCCLDCCLSFHTWARTNARDVSTGDLLFVPSGGGVSWRAKGAEDEAVTVRFCYVDASNFDSVKSQLSLYAAVEVRLLRNLLTWVLCGTMFAWTSGGGGNALFTPQG